MGEGIEVGGGGSMDECVPDGFDEKIESGSGAIASSDEEVSMVILTVGFVMDRIV